MGGGDVYVQADNQVVRDGEVSLLMVMPKVQTWSSVRGVVSSDESTCVKVTEEQNGWRDGAELCEKFRRIRG